MTLNPALGSAYQLNETSFHLLMKMRIHKVLLISSTYDAFILEEDGRIDEQIFNEYVSLSLRYPPVFIKATSAEQAFFMLENESIDLVITMLSIEDMDPFEFSREIKSKYSEIPIVVLTPFSREVTLKLENEDLSAIDYVFSWLGNANLLLAIIKLIEDKMNVEHDVDVVGVQTIILVEDSIRFYSSYLPLLYKFIFKQSQEFMTEGLNEHQKMLRMRGRPKVLLATNYEDAIRFYERFKQSLLGIISDFSYTREAKLDKMAGVKLCEKVKEEDQYLPFLLQSSEKEYVKIAKELNVKFLHKGSTTLDRELRSYINEYLAFGKFVFLDPKTMTEIASAPDLNSLQHKIMEVSDESLLYHIERNHFSKWLNARALFPIADKIKYLTKSDFENLDEIRTYLFDTIVQYRLNKGRGVIAEFDRKRFDEYTIFSRIGNGSVGGKARGLAFINSMIKKNKLLNKWDDVVVTIPKTVVLSTDIFDEFMDDNNLYNVALSSLDDEEILKHFINSRLPFRIHEDLLAFISVLNNPIAVRSSSLLEDSHYQPFAGVYATIMIPNLQDDENKMIQQLSIAIKSVYASVFYKSSKGYMKATQNVIDSEKMGIVLQEVCGSPYDCFFYPTFSGVARSINFYPLDPEKAEDGVANIALGLGKHIVEGGISLRFSPAYPQKVLQLSEVKSALKETQKYFYALDLRTSYLIPSVDEGINLVKRKIEDAEQEGSLKYVASTYDIQNEALRDDMQTKGKRIITFSQILKHHVFPLADILKTILRVGANDINKPIEIEFAVNLNVAPGKPKIFNLLQIRPIMETDEIFHCKLEEINPDDCILTSESALGNGIISDLRNIVYVKPESFNSKNTKEIALSVDEINQQFSQEDKNYILIGPGRWGSSDPWLGIPVNWTQICQARLIVESGLENYRIDPSQGTHFFQNLTSFRVGYFTINPFANDGYFDLEYLNMQKAVFENQYIRHICFNETVKVMIDGKNNRGVLLKAGHDGCV